MVKEREMEEVKQLSHQLLPSLALKHLVKVLLRDLQQISWGSEWYRELLPQLVQSNMLLLYICRVLCQCCSICFPWFCRPGFVQQKRKGGKGYKEDPYVFLTDDSELSSSVR